MALLITQARHLLSKSDGKNVYVQQSSFIKCKQNMRTDAHIQYVNNHHAKFYYKGKKTHGVTDYTNQTPLSISGGIKCLSSTPHKNEKIRAHSRRCIQTLNNKE